MPTTATDPHGATGESGFRFEAAGEPIQNLAPPRRSMRFEGVAFSPTGGTLGVAASDADTVALFRRKADGHFEPAPFWSICGAQSGLNYPHDLSFSSSGGTELLAIAQRAGAITVYQKDALTGFRPRPAAEIRGPAARLNHSDGVAFVPPHDDYLAACNLVSGSISFFRRTRRSAPAFRPEPAFELKHGSIFQPDGLAFSRCGTWLAVANHGNHTVSIFRRRSRLLPGMTLKYGPAPVTVIEDRGLRYPHSVAFTPETGQLVVSNAGANYLSVYRPQVHGSGLRWSQSPVVRKIIGSGEYFDAINARNKMEGGPKGIAIHGDTLAVCSPEYGINIYRVRETVQGV